MRTKINLGKVDYNNTGRKINQVTVEVEISERIQLRDQDLNPIEKCNVFSMSGGVWDGKHTDYISCGQMCYQLPELFPQNKPLKRLVEIWEEWHLNDLKAGTHKQQSALKQWEKRPNGWSYSEDCEYLKSIGLHVDNGYQYGTSWLCDPLPTEIENEVNELVKELSR